MPPSVQSAIIEATCTMVRQKNPNGKQTREQLAWAARRASTWLLGKLRGKYSKDGRERSWVKGQALEETMMSTGKWNIRVPGHVSAIERSLTFLGAEKECSCRWKALRGIRSMTPWCLTAASGIRATSVPEPRKGSFCAVETTTCLSVQTLRVSKEWSVRYCNRSKEEYHYRLSMRET